MRACGSPPSCFTQQQHFHRICTKTLKVLDEMRLTVNGPSSVCRFDHLTGQGPNTHMNMHTRAAWRPRGVQTR